MLLFNPMQQYCSVGFWCNCTSINKLVNTTIKDFGSLSLVVLGQCTCYDWSLVQIYVFLLSCNNQPWSKCTCYSILSTVTINFGSTVQLTVECTRYLLLSIGFASVGLPQWYWGSHIVALVPSEIILVGIGKRNEYLTIRKHNKACDIVHVGLTMGTYG